jgi:cytochrome P450
LTSNENITKSEEYKYLWDWLGKGLLTSTGPLWRNRRKLLTPAFHFKILEDFLPIFNEQSDVLVKVLREATDKEFIDIFDVIIPCTLDVICGMFYLLCGH